MISLPIPFILAKAALPAMAIENPVSFARYMAETPTNYQSAARRSGCGRRQASHDERKREDDADWYREPSPQPGCTCLALATARRSASGSTRSSFMLIDAVDLKCRSVPFALSARGIARDVIASSGHGPAEPEREICRLGPKIAAATAF
jgi:hypothetical protein